VLVRIQLGAPSFGSLAQSGEHWLVTPEARGSKPLRVAKLTVYSSVRFRARVWGARGHWFESSYTDQIKDYAQVVQLVGDSGLRSRTVWVRIPPWVPNKCKCSSVGRASGCQPEGRGIVTPHLLQM
jgi:hypothetical protein